MVCERRREPHVRLQALRAAYPEVLKQELESWDRVKEDWPEDRSFAAFQRWFDYSIHWIIFDIADPDL